MELHDSIYQENSLALSQFLWVPELIIFLLYSYQMSFLKGANAHVRYRNLKKIALAGVGGEVAFEAYSWLLSPVLFGPILEPANLVTEITAKVTGIMPPYSVAFIIHFLIGAVFFALLVFLAPLIGRPFMMEFGAYTRSSFVAHTGMMMIVGLILSMLMPSKPESV